MIALVQKDLYVLWKQMKSFCVLLAVYALVPYPFLNIFGVVYGAILPYTAMAYDERAKWGQLAAMMPYRTRDLVLSKYVLGWLFSATAAVLAGAGQLVIHRSYQPESGNWFTPETALISFGMALIIMAVALPVMFRFKVEKARVIVFILIFAVAGSGGALASVTERLALDGMALPRLLPASVAFLLAGAALTAASVPLSIKLYRAE